MSFNQFRMFVFTIMLPYPVAQTGLYIGIAFGAYGSFVSHDPTHTIIYWVLTLIFWVNLCMHLFLLLTNPKDKP